jgi:gamma-glutamyltranspeptidase/glutathione hydrolase
MLLPAISMADDRAMGNIDGMEKAPVVRSNSGIVAADNTRASKIGAKILERGGSAADAGVTTLLALGVVHPFSSGLGGGGFCLHRSAKDGEVDVVDFREKAPMKAHRNMYVVDGEVKQSLQMKGGLAVGVPGEPAGLWALQKRFGKLDWDETVQPALQIAKKGHKAPKLLEKRLDKKSKVLEEFSALGEAFKSKDGDWFDTGELVKRPKLAKTLEMYRDEGPEPFYRGAIGDAIVKEVNEAGGIFQKKDLKQFSVAERSPIEGTYHGYNIFSMPPPSSGGTTLVQTLNILEDFELDDTFGTARNVHLLTESLKHAFADRARWLGDTDFEDVPIEMLISKSYADKLRRFIEPKSVQPTKMYGTRRPGSDEPGTTHVSVIDKKGNMLACTSTINTSFGSKVFVEEYGLVMNNEMGDFTAQPGVPNNYGLIGTEQNAVEPEKRPLSSMSPTLVMKDGNPYMVVGASGGPTIITGTLLAILRDIQFDLSPAKNIVAPRIHHQWLPKKLFTESDFGVGEKLKNWGHNLKIQPAFSAVQMIVKGEDGAFVGVSDPRKLGEAAAADSTDKEQSK